MAEETRRFLLVYNADGGLWGELSYVAGKLLRQASCALCDITHGLTKERKDWQACKQRLEVEVAQLHRNELDEAGLAAAEGRFPCVLEELDGAYRRVAGPRELDACAGSAVCLEQILHAQLSG